MKAHTALTLFSLASTVAVGASTKSMHRRTKASLIAERALPGPGQGGGIGATVVSATEVPISGGAVNGGTTAGNAQTGAAASGGGSGGSASFQPALAGTTPNPAGGGGGGNGGGGGGGGGGGAAAAGDPNLLVLNFALTLENLESQFYAEAIAVMTPAVMQKAGLSAFQATAVTQQLAQTLIDEQTHVQILQQTIQSLGAVPFAGCSFNFASVLTDPVTFLSTARSVEAVGVGAYIGGAGLLTNGAVLSAAATILGIESRHQSAFNVFSGGSLSPQAFEIGMSPQQVLALVGGFLQGCKASDLGLTANQPLSVIDGLTQSTLFTTGSILQFQTSAQIQQVNNAISCQMLVGGATTAIVMPASSCIVPPQINGAVAIFLTSDANPLAGNLASQKPNNIIAGPALIFSDINQGEVLQQVFTVQNLGLRSLPSANLGFAALQPPSGQQGNQAAIGGNGLSGLGFSQAFASVPYGAMPKSVVQSTVQFAEVNGGQRNVATGGGVGAYAEGWLPANNPPAPSRRSHSLRLRV